MRKFRTTTGDWNFILICIWLVPDPLNKDKKFPFKTIFERWWYNEEKERKIIEREIKKIKDGELLFKGQFGRFEAYVEQMTIAQGSAFGYALTKWYIWDNIKKIN